MSPITTTPGSGFPDWRRVVNWDSALLYSHDAVVLPSDTSPVLNVQPYAYIGGFDASTVNPCWVQVLWAADQAMTQLAGIRRFPLGDSMGSSAQYRIPNLGPWCQFTWTSVAGAQFHHSVNIFGTNRFHPLELIPEGPVVLLPKTVLEANGITTVAWGSEYYAGPARASIVTPATGWSITVNTISSTGATIQLMVAALAAGNNTVDIIVPFGAWNIAVTNNSGVLGTSTITATAPQTGST